MNNDFYPRRFKILNNQISDILKDNKINQKNKSIFEILNISSLDNIRDNSILFLSKKDFYPDILNVHVITSNIEIFNDPGIQNVTFVKDLDISYNLLINHLYLHEDNIDFKDDFKIINNSYVSVFAEIHSSTIINNNCVIGRGVKIGQNCLIKNNVVIKNCLIGNNVIISDNTTIGSTGFGFNIENMGAYNLNPQIGIVIIEDDVYIGSNCSIDRGKIDNTVIGKKSMLDNQIHIGHNVIIGENACIAAQTGISGSTKIGKNIVVGGQSGFAGHLKIGDNVVVAAKSGVTKNINNNSTIAGFPAIDIKQWKLNIINQKKKWT